jgi:EmrB/QacA subfamily drug resistance transporter
MLSLNTLANSPHKKWWVLIAMAISLGMTFIDQTAVAIALPKIQKEFVLSPVLLQWIVNAYLLVLGCFLIIGGRLGDLFQHQRIFLFGLIIFTISSITCGTAPNITWLICSRAIQGFGAALIIPNSSVLVINSFSKNEKGKAMGIYMGSALLFLPFALFLGGLFTQYLSWRFIFWINAPLAVISFLIAFHAILAKPAITVIRKPFDWLGMVSLLLALSSLVFALMESTNFGFASYITLGLLGFSLIFFILFYYFEQKALDPIIKFNIFHNKLILCTCILFFSMAMLSSLFVFSAIFYQQALSYTPAIAGLLFLPDILCVMISAPIAGKLYDRYGPALPTFIGLVLAIVGLVLNANLALLENYWILLPGIVVISIGSPFVQSSMNTAALSSVSEETRGIVSGILNATRQISNSITLAVLTTTIVLSHHFLPEKYVMQNTPQVASAFAYSMSLYVCAIIIFLGFIAAYFLLKSHPQK